MIDIGRNNCTSCSNFLTHEFWRNFSQVFCTEILSGMLTHIDTIELAQVFTNGDVFHFRCDDALLGIMHLGDVTATLGFARFLDMRETDCGGTDIA